MTSPFRTMTLTPTHRLIMSALFLVAAVILLLSVMNLADVSAPAFWACMVTGSAAWLIASFVWSLNPAALPTQLFLLSALATLGFSFAAAPQDYSIAASLVLFWINCLGATLFGIAMIALFLVYPKKLPHWRALSIVTALFFGGWALASLTGLVTTTNVQHVTFVEMLLIIAAVGAQIYVARNEPQSRVIAMWLGGSVLIGAGSFIALVAFPNVVMGRLAYLQPEYAFLFFLVIYVGVAVGLRRYRLFALNEWAFQFALYLSAAILVVLLDAVFVYMFALTGQTALGLALLVTVFAYLPFRDRIAGLLLRRRQYSSNELLEHVVSIAFTPLGPVRTERWHNALQGLFEPLELRSLDDGPSGVVIEEEGAVMSLPSLGSLPPMQLRYPFRGRGLFGPRHRDLAVQLATLLRQADAARESYRQGVMAERSRISQDMHDNIGAQLLSALHHEDVQRKDTMIRASLSDLRTIINDASRPELTFIEGIADIRAETMDRLSVSGIELEWIADVEGQPSLTPREAHGFRSIIREAISNIIKHADATRAYVHITHDGRNLSLTIRDNGQGAPMSARHGGNGLSNMAARVTGLGGTLLFPSVDDGFALSFNFPVSSEMAS
ncbi:sensor histidine kinase [Parvularcula sp. LCG005]|uniref:sensor histidine kinase n=1 Tax=Parvularcula sp. LCG005 TaxID=3078805 RepID=UPI00294290B3|nr:ATP-binding protein [Parvularcula sp. LCG005]WOI54200.1 ATP-binding protein [Parvularcula sp. LCG005]